MALSEDRALLRATRGAAVVGTTGTTGTTTTTSSPGGAGTDGGSSLRPAWAPGRARALLVGLAVLAVGGLVGGAVPPVGGPTGSAGGPLPATVAGLAAQRPGPAGGPADQLLSRLSAEPSVADVAVRAYGAGDRVMVVLDLTPRSALTDAAAGELTARVLGTAGTGRGSSQDVRSAVTADGRALVTCSTPRPGTSTCVSVEADRALVVLTSGDDTDPVDRATAVRDEVRAGT